MRTQVKKPRGDWNGIKPYTRVIPSGKLYNRRKEKRRAYEG